MRRLLTAAGLLVLGGAAVGAGSVHADQYQCLNDLPFGSHVCAETTNSAGAGADEHRLTISGYQGVPGLALGFSLQANCDDDGGASTADVKVNAGPDTAVPVPAQCPDLP